MGDDIFAYVQATLNETVSRMIVEKGDILLKANVLPCSLCEEIIEETREHRFYLQGTLEELCICSVVLKRLIKESLLIENPLSTTLPSVDAAEQDLSKKIDDFLENETHASSDVSVKSNILSDISFKKFEDTSANRTHASCDLSVKSTVAENELSLSETQEINTKANSLQHKTKLNAAAEKFMETTHVLVETVSDSNPEALKYLIEIQKPIVRDHLVAHTYTIPQAPLAEHSNHLQHHDYIVTPTKDETSSSRVSKKQIFVCNCCSFNTDRQSHFIRHIRLHDKLTTHRCDHEGCKFATLRQSHLTRHKEIAHGDGNELLQCDFCDCVFLSQPSLDKHRTLRHFDGLRKKQESKQLLKCDFCPYTTRRPKFMERHHRRHILHDSKPPPVLQCNKCSYNTTDRSHYSRHTTRMHTDVRNFKCKECESAFKHREALQSHLVTHHIDRLQESNRLKCQVCGQQMRSSRELAKHSALHGSVKRLICDQCGASFKTRAVYRRHIRHVHVPVARFYCDICQQPFKTAFALKRHKNTHNPSAKKNNSSQSVPPKEKEPVFDSGNLTDDLERNNDLEDDDLENDLDASCELTSDATVAPSRTVLNVAGSTELPGSNLISGCITVADDG